MQSTPSTIPKLFAGRPAARKLFALVRAEIKKLGPSRMKVTKTQVSFGLQRNFAFVWLPQMYSKKRPEDSVTLTFDLPKRVRDKQIVDATEIVPGRWVHHVVITGPRDITGKVRGWLRTAYEWRGM